MKPKADDAYEWVIVADDGRSSIGDLPDDLQLVAPVPTSRSVAPPRPQTPTRNFRIPDSVYQPARDVAAANGDTVTDVVVRSLILYTERANPQAS
ncbi:Arc-like repressor [Gordonia phage BritBrat]|uniref:DNA binding domain protein n=1 Tax=Gordonia phage BritBrat TaxID=1838064 RepID=A0A166XZH3_9CAUD|nr:Arc-like repressor [Gordonia phage BritBrat]ANA85240.1 DNA binding domain protein [Gordonia phage BritBrat]